MDMDNYLVNMGITAAQRAFFSYMAKPQGSYGLHMIFRLFLKRKSIIMHDRERPHWCRFLADYSVFRLYIARFVLKAYARDYPPLLSLYAGFDRIDETFPEFIKKEADPGRGVGDISLLPDHLETLYSPEKIEALHDRFNRMAEKAERDTDSPDAALKSFTTEVLSYLSGKDEVPCIRRFSGFFRRKPWTTPSTWPISIKVSSPKAIMKGCMQNPMKKWSGRKIHSTRTTGCRRIFSSLWPASSASSWPGPEGAGRLLHVHGEDHLCRGFGDSSQAYSR